MSDYHLQLREYNTSDKQLLRVINTGLPHRERLYHAVETTRGTFVICHGGIPYCSRDDPPHAVSEQFRMNVI